MLLVAKNIISDSNLFFYLYNFSQSTTFEYNSGRKEPEVLRDYPVFFQAGNSTGIVPPGWAFSRGLFINDKVDYYVVKI